MRELKLQRPLAIIDLETTGTSFSEDRIVEIAIVTLHPDGHREQWSQRVHPERPIPPESTAIHGISDDDVRDAPRFAEIAGEVVKRLNHCDVGGFNAMRFDLPLLQCELERAGATLSADSRLVVDAQVIFHQMERRDLSAAVRFYCKRELEGAHGALADADATLDVLLAQVGRYADPPQHIPDTVAGIHEICHHRDDRYIDPDGKLIWVGSEAAIGFGKHRGTTLRKMAETEAGYLQWILRKDFGDEVKAVVRDASNGVFPVKPS